MLTEFAFRLVYCWSWVVFSILPFLGIAMLPLGLMLIIRDVPFLCVPVGRLTIWGTRKWAAVRLRVFWQPPAVDWCDEGFVDV